MTKEKRPLYKPPSWLQWTGWLSGSAFLVLIVALVPLFIKMDIDVANCRSSDCDGPSFYLFFFTLIPTAIAGIIFGISSILKRTWQSIFDEKITIDVEGTPEQHGRKIRKSDNRPNTRTHILLPYHDSPTLLLIPLTLVLMLLTVLVNLLPQTLVAAFLLSQVFLVGLWFFRHKGDGFNYQITIAQSGWLVTLPFTHIVYIILQYTLEPSLVHYEDLPYLLTGLVSLPYIEALFFVAGFMLITQVAQPYRAFSRSAILGTFIAATSATIIALVFPG